MLFHAVEVQLDQANCLVESLRTRYANLYNQDGASTPTTSTSAKESQFRSRIRPPRQRSQMSASIAKADVEKRPCVVHLPTADTNLTIEDADAQAMKMFGCRLRQDAIQVPPAALVGTKAPVVMEKEGEPECDVLRRARAIISSVRFLYNDEKQEEEEEEEEEQKRVFEEQQFVDAPKLLQPINDLSKTVQPPATSDSTVDKNQLFSAQQLQGDSQSSVRVPLGECMWVPLLIKSMVTKASASVYFQQACDLSDEGIVQVGSRVRILDEQAIVIAMKGPDLVQFTVDKPLEANVSHARYPDGLVPVFVLRSVNQVTSAQHARARACGSGQTFVVSTIGDNNTSCNNFDRRRGSHRRKQALERNCMKHEESLSRLVSFAEFRRHDFEKKTTLLAEKTRERLRHRRQQQLAEEQKRAADEANLEMKKKEKARAAEEKAAQAAEESHRRVVRHRRSSSSVCSTPIDMAPLNQYGFLLQPDDPALSMISEQVNVVANSNNCSKNGEFSGQRLQQIAKKRVQETRREQRKAAKEEKKRKQAEKAEAKAFKEQHRQRVRQELAGQDIHATAWLRREKYEKIAAQVKEQEDSRYEAGLKEKRLKSLEVNSYHHYRSSTKPRQTQLLPQPMVIQKKSNQEEEDEQIWFQQSTSPHGLVQSFGNTVDFKAVDSGISCEPGAYDACTAQEIKKSAILVKQDQYAGQRFGTANASRFGYIASRPSAFSTAANMIFPVAKGDVNSVLTPVMQSNTTTNTSYLFH